MGDSNRFTYLQGEIAWGKSQCGLCVYRFADREESCEKYDSKPKQILMDEKKCPFIRLKGQIEL